MAVSASIYSCSEVVRPSQEEDEERQSKNCYAKDSHNAGREDSPDEEGVIENIVQCERHPVAFPD